MDYIRDHLDLPTLSALEDEWRMRPPAHQLIAAYLGYEAPAAAQEQDDVDGEGSKARPPSWLPGRGVAASEALRAATTTDEALRAAEQLFFGEVQEYGKR